MVWGLFYLATPKPTWQYSPILKPDWIRLRYQNPPPGAQIELCQAQTYNGNELFEPRLYPARAEYEILQLLKPPGFEYRRLGFRLVGQSTARWTFRVEVNSMPLYGQTTLPDVKSSEVAASAIPSATSAGTIRAANAERKGLTIFNRSAANLFIELEPTATPTVSTTKYGCKIGPGDYYEIPYGYTGGVTGTWDEANGEALVREFT